MAKNIQTHNAKIDLVKKFLDYANVADASYALLHYIRKNAENETQENKADNLTFGDKLQQDIEVTNHKGKTIIKPKGTNTAYACAIEARFNEDKTRDWCIIPFTNKCLIEKDKIDNNNITQVKLDSKLSKRTIDFTNRFRILAHQENTDSGFSATLFEDTQDSNQKIFAIGFFDDMLDADMDLALGKLASNQYIDMIKFYEDCVQKGCITKSTPLTITGHSLGGALAQLFALSFANDSNENPSIINEVYTFNILRNVA